MEQVDAMLLERNLERLERFRLLDDTFMRQVFKDDLPLMQHVLRTITGLEDLTLFRVETQRDLKRLSGSHSVSLDVWGEDDEGTQYDLEVQTGDKLDPLRFRYYGSCMDVEALPAGAAYSALPQRWLVVVLERDPLGAYVSSRHYRMNDQRLGELGDGAHLLYANAAYRGDDALGSLMRDFCQSDPDEIRDELLRERVQYFKRDPEGVRHMCRISEEIYNEGVDQERIAATQSLMDKLGKGAAEALALIGVPEDERDRYLIMLGETRGTAPSASQRA